MPLTNTSKPTTSLTNIANVKDFETWDSNATTWNTEIRTWDEMGSLIGNTSKPTTSIINISKPA